MLEIDTDSLEERPHRWYHPAEVVDPEIAERLARASREASRDALELLLRQAVERRLMADVPLGAMCSGGVDSSLITAYAHDLDPSIRIYCATILDQPEADEAPWARMVAEQLGSELREVPVTAETFRAGLVAATAHYEYPSTHVSMVPIAAISRRAHSEGVKAILVGEAADELFGGYGLRIQRELVDLIDRDRPARLAARRLRRLLHDWRTRNEPPHPGVCPEALAAEAAIARAAERAYRHSPRTRRKLEVQLIEQLSVGPLPSLINRLDRNGMQGSIEMRLPFLDRDVVEFALNLEVDKRVRPHSKGILRELAIDRFGERIGRRPKQPFQFPVREYIRAGADPDFLLEGRLRELLRWTRAEWRERRDRAAPQDEFLLWTGEIWARLTLERKTVEQVEGELWREAPVASAA
jgi:asparagine synthase (glutamine-hydrolysing)